MITSKEIFEEEFLLIFGNINRSNLSTFKGPKMRIELGGDKYSFDERVRQAKHRSMCVLNYCFQSSEIWMRIIIWDKLERDKIITEVVKYKEADFFEGEHEGENVLYIYLKNYIESLVENISSLIINFETGKKHSANITCYFISFSKHIIANIYDDRGMDVVANNEELSLLNKKFVSWTMS